MIRLCRITTFFAADEYGLPAHLGGSCTELGLCAWAHKLHNSDLTEIVLKKTLCLPVGFLVFGLLDLAATNRKSGYSSSELTLTSHRFFLFWLNYRLFHHDIV